MPYDGFLRSTHRNNFVITRGQIATITVEPTVYEVKQGNCFRDKTKFFQQLSKDWKLCMPYRVNYSAPDTWLPSCYREEQLKFLKREVEDLCKTIGLDRLDLPECKENRQLFDDYRYYVNVVSL